MDLILKFFNITSSLYADFLSKEINIYIIRIYFMDFCLGGRINVFLRYNFIIRDTIRY